MFGGKFNYGKEYAKYRPKQPASIFEQYVDETPDLLDAWNQIEGDPQGTQGSYWIPRGASSKQPLVAPMRQKIRHLLAELIRVELTLRRGQAGLGLKVFLTCSLMMALLTYHRGR